MKPGVTDAELVASSRALADRLVWRFVAYRYLLQVEPEAKRPLSQLGSLRGGGRYNIGFGLATHHAPFGAIYTSFDASTATSEMRFPSAPETPYILFPIRATLQRVLDLRDERVTEPLRIEEEKLYGEWRESSKILGVPAYPQRVAARAFDAGIEGLLTRSVASEGRGTNLTIYPANLAGNSRVSVTADIDDPTVVDVLLPPDDALAPDGSS